MATRTPPPSSSGNFDDYVRCLRAEVDAAAKVRWEDPVAFLWRARRVGEALLHALRVRNVPGSGHDPSASIDGLLKHEQLRAKLGRENFIDLQGLQSLGNTGSHVQGEVINYDHTAGVAAAHLANVVAWFFRTQHSEAAVPDDVGRALEILREPARWQSSPDNLVRRAEERISRLTGELGAASEAARRSGAASGQGPTIPPRLSIGRAALAALGVALPAFGGGLAAGRGCDVRASPEPMTEAPRPPMAPVVTDSGVVRSVRRTPDEMAAPTHDATPTPCPPGTVDVAAASFELLPPPDRRGVWRTRPGTTPRQVGTRRVCLDTHAAPMGRVLAWDHAPTLPFRDCAERPSDDDAAMPCLNHAQAMEWCASRGGRLPRIVEWEALARQIGRRSGVYVDPPVDRQSTLLEWTADPFPPEVFDLATPSLPGNFVTRGVLPTNVVASPRQPHHSWNHQVDSRRVHSLFVRCAFDPGARAP